MLQIFKESWMGYAQYLWSEISFQSSPWWHNYFLWLTIVSMFFFGLELARPWRVDQPKFRSDFWLDVFYMYFNFFLFSLIIYNAASSVVVHYIDAMVMGITGIKLNHSSILSELPYWAILTIGFILRDFIQWWVHRLLHRVSWLWEIHKVHHSIGQMGFAGHLRYHWMENVVYGAIQYLPLAFIGIGLYDFFVIHIFALVIGHYNHANMVANNKIVGGIIAFLFSLLVISSYPLWPVQYQLLTVIGATLIGIFLLSRIVKFVFNGPEMHIWHHAHDIPASHRYGINFGLSLALWDYVFHTAYIPHTGRDIKLGFPGVEKFPKTFLHQLKIRKPV